jgi:hypothetical protein
MSNPSKEFVRFIAEIPFDDGPATLIFDIPIDVWAQLDDACLHNKHEVGGMLIGEQTAPNRAIVRSLMPFPSGTNLGKDMIQLPADWNSAERPGGFQGTWHTHPTPDPASVQDFNHLLYMVRDDFWPFMIVLSKRGRITEPSIYIGIKTPETPLLFEFEMEGFHNE